MESSGCVGPKGCSLGIDQLRVIILRSNKEARIQQAKDHPKCFRLHGLSDASPRMTYVVVALNGHVGHYSRDESV